MAFFNPGIQSLLPSERSLAGTHCQRLLRRWYLWQWGCMKSWTHLIKTWAEVASPILSACIRCSRGIRPRARCPRRDDERGRCRDKDTSLQTQNWKRENIWQDSVPVNLCGTLCCKWACRMPEVSPNALSWTWLPQGGESSTFFLRAEEIPALKGEESCSLIAPFIQRPGAVAFALLSQSDPSAAPSPVSPLLSHCQ